MPEKVENLDIAPENDNISLQIDEIKETLEYATVKDFDESNMVVENENQDSKNPMFDGMPEKVESKEDIKSKAEEDSSIENEYKQNPSVKAMQEKEYLDADVTTEINDSSNDHEYRQNPRFKAMKEKVEEASDADTTTENNDSSNDHQYRQNPRFKAMKEKVEEASD